MRQTVLKAELVEAIQKHFAQMRVEENAVLHQFLATIAARQPRAAGGGNGGPMRG